MNAIVPIPRTPLAIRVATMDDLPFLDSLQKQHNKALGFFPRAQMEGYLRNQWVLIAEDQATRQPVGYCASRDRYLKRDELGVIYQLCVAPGVQRKLIGASLVKAVFERSAYGCRLYCCWCAQDLDANHFWESLGFVPIAFRAGSGKRKRVHIFWQKRIDADPDQSAIRNPKSAIPYWYPFKTDSGAIREDRIVLPIPPGVHWKDVKAVSLPDRGPGILPEPGSAAPRERADRRSSGQTPKPQSKLRTMGGLYSAPPAPAKKQRAPKAKPPAVKVCPKHLAAARELRDRYLERVNAQPQALPAAGRYDVSRLTEPAPQRSTPARLLPAA